MYKVLRLTVFVTAIFGLCAGMALADWAPGDGYKMHYPQLPDEEGWDVNATAPMAVGDDWRCSATGPVDEIHFWGSWKDGFEGVITSFRIQIYSDIPADPPQLPFSRPGTLLWSADITDFIAVHIVPPDEPWEGWFDPGTFEILTNNHQDYWQYNITGIPEPFFQEEGNVYWLVISANVEQGPAPATWGWKSSIDHYNDAAVWMDMSGIGEWLPLGEPTTPISNGFNAINMQGFVEGFGIDAYGDGWYYYENDNWWNIWFYDHVYDPDRLKLMTIIVDVSPPAAGDPGRLILAFNWATPEWSLLGNPYPPIPPLDPLQEDLYIEREIVYDGPVIPGPNIFHAWVPDYNPEWVSVDISGYDYVLDGFIEHMCMGQMDMAFVINSSVEPEGACCYNGGTLCAVTTRNDCETNLHGTYKGDGTTCWGDGDMNGYDDYCDDCCNGIRGDVNCNGAYEPDISDIVRLIDHLYQSKAPLCCQEEADTKVDGNIDISDIVRLIDYLYLSKDPMASCP